MKIFVPVFLFLSCLCSAQTVCIDPGHPSEVGRGTQGKHITEIKAVWQVAVKLKKELEMRGVKVVMTKSKEEELVKNKDRSATANKAHVDLMVRLHCDDAAGTGYAIYYPDQKGTAQGKTGPSDDVLKACGKIAPVFHEEFKKAIGDELHDNGLLSDTKTAVGGKYGALIGSIFSEVPVVLIEMCRLNNPKDEAYISSEKGQNALAKALAEATIRSIRETK
ncbi:MAG: N-acetylmuramoyl-L-alanine amidase [Armatimonadetes bacterium]|nr:N-acetylmuramoyl-L-alanine amidase [Armatimonadota bacterium]